MPVLMPRATKMLTLAVEICAVVVWCAMGGFGQAPAVSRVIGTVTKIEGDSITIASDSNGEVRANLTFSTRVLRVAAGEKDLKNATAITIRDLQTSDRVLVRGQSGADGRAINALAVIVIKQADLSDERRREREDWQRRGVGGLVSEVDSAHGTITLSSGGLGETRNIVVHTAKDTILRRYALNSTRFDDARSAPLDQIKPGDQLLARGESSSDGSSIMAEEVVSGTFRNIAGTVTSVDAAGHTVTAQDLIKKGEVQIKVSPESQIKTIPPEIAQRIAVRLKDGDGDSNGPGNARPFSRSSRPESQGERPSPNMRGERRNGPGGGDLQRLLAHLPSSSLADLHRGDAIMVVSTVGEASGPVTAITVLAGVEPILAAAPNRSASLSAWTLSSPSMEGVEP